MTAANWRIEHWTDDEQLEAVDYAEYWNNARLERGRAFDVSTGDFERMEAHIRNTGLGEDLDEAIRLAREQGDGLGEFGIDLAAGALWAVPLLLGAGAKRVHCLEMSRHRLLDLGPIVLEHYDVDPDQAVLALGSFYELQLADGSMDFALLAQAFHHADRPNDLLAEIARVLRPGGVAIVIGEHRISVRQRVRHAVTSLVTAPMPTRLQQRVLARGHRPRRPFRPRGADIAAPDPVLGDHVYTTAEYRAMFDAAGFQARGFHRDGTLYRGFLLRKNDR